MIKTGSLKGRTLGGQRVAGMSARTRRALSPLRKTCQSSSRCLKVTTSVATSPPPQKTGGCCTRLPHTTAPPDPPFQEVSSHWSLRRGISAEPSTYLSLLLCLYLCVCQQLSALTARHAEGTAKKKQLLWNPAKRLQSRAATVERATLSPNWNGRGRKEQRRIT